MRKKLSIAILAIFILLAGTTTVLANNTATNHVSLDINPSVEISVNIFNNIISIEATNEDGEKLLEGLNLENMTVEQAVNAIMQKAAELGYIADDGSTVVSVITEKEDEELQNAASNGVSLAMSNKKLIAPMYVDSSSPEMRAEAKALGVSPGKYKLIKMLQAIDPTITVDQYKDAKVSAIIRKANELLIANGFEGKPVEDMQDAVDNLEQASGQLEQEQNQETENDEDVNDIQNKNQNEIKNQNTVDNGNKNHTKVKNNKKSILLVDYLYI